MKGPDLPLELEFPCSVDINDDEIFIFGYAIFERNFVGLIFNQMANSMENITFNNFPCYYRHKVSRLSCAYLKHDDSVVTAVDDCIAILNLTSWKWNISSLDYNQGLVFNAEDSVIFIGSNMNDGSDIYQVNLIIF